MHNHTNEGNSNFSNDDEDIVDLEDLLGMPCPECEKGLFDETTVDDERNGVLHCDKCNFETKRFVFPDEDEFYNDNGDTIVMDYSDDKHFGEGYDWQEVFANYNKKPVKRCTDSHPPLPLEVNGMETEIYGSSCSRPIVKDADLYISLDYNAPVYAWEQPWYRNDDNKQHIRYFIEDMGLPDDPEEFKDLVDFVIDALADGKKVHAGCIAGHGRTGTLLAAIAQETMGPKLDAEGISAIEYVRTNYCKKAVETLSQVLFLNAEFGVAIPKENLAFVNEFKSMFLEEIQVPYDDVIKQGQFMATVKIIDSLEAVIYQKYNPKPVSKFETLGKGMTGGNVNSVNQINASTSVFANQTPIVNKIPAQPWSLKPNTKIVKKV